MDRAVSPCQDVRAWNQLLDNDGKGGDYGVMPYNEYQHWGGMENSPNQNIPPPNGPSNSDFKRMVRLEDEHYFEKAKHRSSVEQYNGFGKSISNLEYNAMSPRSESDEEQMNPARRNRVFWQRADNLNMCFIWQIKDNAQILEHD